MLTVYGDKRAFCDRVARRDFLKAGLLGFGGLGLADLLRLRASGAAGRTRKSVIMICLNGGPSHLDMYDMKPAAPAEIRGEFRPVATNMPGIDICELMPRQTAIADKLAIVRSLKMIQPNHQLHEVYTGFPTDDARPALGSIISMLRGRASSGLPRYVSLSLTDHPRTVAKAELPQYAGLAHAPFEPSDAILESMSPSAAISADRLGERKSLLGAFDQFLRAAETQEPLAGADAFNQQAFDILTSPRVRDAFDVGLEADDVRELYGGDLKSKFGYQFGHTWRGDNFLRARRLVEAGVPIVTLAPGAWDHHGNVNGVRGSIFERLGERLPMLDRSLYALITDLDRRGMLDDVLVVMWGEFGRTPRINKGAGRDHWTRAGFVLFAGGGLKTGQIVGATDSQGGSIVDREYGAQNVLATIYHVLGINPSETVQNFSGRPIQLLDDQRPIVELI